MHRGRAVARAGEAEAEPQEAALGAAVEAGEVDDLVDGEPGDGARPFRRLVGEMRLDVGAEIGVPREIRAIDQALFQQHVHHGERQGAVGAGPQHEPDVGGLDGRRAIDVDHHELGAAFAPRPGDVGHDVDLGRHGIAAPHHDQVGLGHLARIGAEQLAHAGPPARFGRRDADRGLLPRIAHRMPQPVDAPTLDHTHRAARVVGPYRLGSMAEGRALEGLGDLVEGGVPRDRPELPAALGADPLQRLLQAVGMMDPLGVAGDLGAHHAVGVAVRGGAADPADPGRGQPLDLERAGARAIVRAGRLPEFFSHGRSEPPPGHGGKHRQSLHSRNAETGSSIARTPCVRRSRPKRTELATYAKSACSPAKRHHFSSSYCSARAKHSLSDARKICGDKRMAGIWAFGPAERS